MYLRFRVYGLSTMKLKIYASADIEPYVKRRKGEKKYGQYVQCAEEISGDFSEQLRQSDAEYVLLGIPEDIGVQANLGKKGAASAWDAALPALFNTQHNPFNKGDELYVLGHLDLEEERSMSGKLDLSLKDDLEKAGKLVENIDKEVSHIIHKIVALGKKPIVIGGGHNNAYGIMKGCALALNTPVHVVNFDAHSDFRKRKRRHSGNAFSCAFHEGFLQKYYIFGLHENYTSKSIFKKLKKYETYIQYATFEEMAIQKKKSFSHYLHQALAYVNKGPFGIELDCDAIARMPSSARTPSGFSVTKARRFVSTMGNHLHARYLHICEAAPDPADETEMQQTGKLIAYLITDFIKKPA